MNIFLKSKFQELAMEKETLEIQNKKLTFKLNNFEAKTESI